MYKLLKPLKIFSFETLPSSIKVNVRVQACDQASTAINSIQAQFMFRKEVKSELEFDKFLLVLKKSILNWISTAGVVHYEQIMRRMLTQLNQSRP